MQNNYPDPTYSGNNLNFYDDYIDDSMSSDETWKHKMQSQTPSWNKQEQMPYDSSWNQQQAQTHTQWDQQQQMQPQKEWDRTSQVESGTSWKQTQQIAVPDNEENNMSLIPSNNTYVPETLSNTAFLPAYLSKHIGKLMRVEFLLANHLETRMGWLMSVGAGYIVLKLYGQSTTMACDIYSIKFVTIVHDNDLAKLPLRY